MLMAVARSEVFQRECREFRSEGEEMASGFLTDKRIDAACPFIRFLSAGRRFVCRAFALSSVREG